MINIDNLSRPSEFLAIWSASCILSTDRFYNIYIYDETGAITE